MCQNSNEPYAARALLDRLFPRLMAAKGGPDVVLRMARFLAEQTSFPDLQGWEDTALKVAEANAAVAQLKLAVDARVRTEEEERARAEARRQVADARAEAAKAHGNLRALQDRLDALAVRMGSQEAGYEFQSWFYELVDHFEISARPPYTHGGRQIDGSVTLDGTTYLIELKFTKPQADAIDIDSLLSKVYQAG